MAGIPPTPRMCRARRSPEERTTTDANGNAVREGGIICTASVCPWVENERRESGVRRWPTEGEAWRLSDVNHYSGQPDHKKALIDGRKSNDQFVEQTRRECEEL